MIRWMQCDVCARLTNRLHSGETCGLEYAACDECCHFDAEAYDEPRALYLDEQPDPREDAYSAHEPHPRDCP